MLLGLSALVLVVFALTWYRAALRRRAFAALGSVRALLRRKRPAPA